jgi:hypothetical protein
MGGRLSCFVSIAFMSGLIACAAQRAAEPDRPTRAAVAPPASSPLAKVEVGMTPREVENVLGPPTDENQYLTGKAFIPFYFGQDRWRRAYFYRGLGRVVFAGGGGFSMNAHVDRVEYDPNEPGRAR